MTGEVIFPTDIDERIAAIVRKDPRFAPYRIGTRSPWSKHIEFGTEGFKGTRPSVSYRKQNRISPVEEDFRKWAKKKMPGLSEGERNRKAHLIYKSVMERGIAPNPFLRPAVHNVLFRYSQSDDPWQGKPQTMETIATDI